ncbi:MAG: ChaN family lipoprotein [Thermodesulfobacteriota bacterium]
MPVSRILIFLIVLSVPAAGWGSGLTYVLDVRIDPAAARVYGTANIYGSPTADIRLSVGNLSNIRVNGKPVSPAASDSLLVTLGQEKPTSIQYEAVFDRSHLGIIDPEHVFLMGGWYPAPQGLNRYTLSVTLPREFTAVSEAENVTKAHSENLTTHLFHFDHLLDSLHLAASSNFVVKKADHKGVAIETYFFKADAALADTYIDHTRTYLDLYQGMLTPYPYRRFAIVENILPTGYSMPTFTLLGRQVVNLPFIVKTSLPHEIVHQWFGNYVHIDPTHGNWAEGLASYLADYFLEEKNGRGRDYRKQLLVNFNAYVNEGNALPASQFQYRRSKSESAIGYGRVAMFFHGLRKRFGDDAFFNALRDFIHNNELQAAAWHDIRESFEKIVGEGLEEHFDARLNRPDVPALKVVQSQLEIMDGAPVLNFTLRQKGEPFVLDIPVQVHTETCIQTLAVHMDRQEQTFTLELDSLPTQVVLDQEYDLMRKLTASETPPVLANIMGREEVIVVVHKEHEPVYRPLIKALGIGQTQVSSPDELTFSELKKHSLIICDHNNPIAQTLLGGPAPPATGLSLDVSKHPYNDTESILLVHSGNVKESMAVQRKLRHYGKYSQLAFDMGKVTVNKTSETRNGIAVLEHPASLALTPDQDPTLGQILDTLLENQVIFVGEKHDRYAHHLNQLEIIRHLYASGADVAVGMEMFHQPFQPVVDDYLAGRIDEHEFLEKSEYYNAWRFDFGLYKPIIDFLKENNIPLLALNIPGNVSRQVAREGLESLNTEQRAWVPEELDFSNAAYRDDLKTVFDQHGAQTGIQEFDYFLQAQILWDESMAARAARFLETHPDHKLVILAGNGHIRFGHGIPQRLYRRSKEPYVIVVQDEAMQAGIADHVLLTSTVKGKPAPKLGVMVEEKDGALAIAGISKKGPAEKAGLEKGDIIRSFDGQSIEDLADLKLALYYCRQDQTVFIKVQRGDQVLEKEITLFAFNPFSMHGKK